MNEPQGPKTRYKTTNWAAYNAALKVRGALTIWLDKDMQWYAPASGKRGRQQTFTDAAIQFCLSIKCLFGLALRQSLGLIQSLLRLAGLNWRVPDFSTISRRQRTLQVQLPYQRSATALDLLVDSTGIKFLGEGEWKRKKHGAEYRRQWRKVHLGIDATRWRFGPLKSQTTAWAMPPCCPNCWPRYRSMSRWQVSVGMEPTTQRGATRR